MDSMFNTKKKNMQPIGKYIVIKKIKEEKKTNTTINIDTEGEDYD